jgi:hypothetical protein
MHKKILGLTATAVLAAQIAYAEKWEISDVFLLGDRAVARGVTSDAAGIVYAAGSGGQDRFIRSSADFGENWLEKDQITLEPDLRFSGRALFNSPSGQVYRLATKSTKWVVLRKGEALDDWTEMGDPYEYLVRHRSTWPLGGCADADENVYVAGTAIQDGTKKTSSLWGHWIVRHFNGAEWNTIDDWMITTAEGTRNEAQGVVTTPSGVYAAGWGRDGQNLWWIVRRSVPTAHGWVTQTIDQYQLKSKGGSEARDIAADPYGNIYVVGFGNAPTRHQGNNGIVRKLRAGEASFETVLELPDTIINRITSNHDGRIHVADNRGRIWTSPSGEPGTFTPEFLPTPPGGAILWTSGVHVDFLGNIFSSGEMRDQNNIGHWIVHRKLNLP